MASTTSHPSPVLRTSGTTRLAGALLVVLLGWTLRPGVAQAPEAPAPGVPEMAARIPGLMARFGVPGMAVLVLRQGAPVWSAAFGEADPASRRPLSLDAIFRVESISKPVTAWGVLRLVERGVLGLDDPVQDHLEKWSPPPGTPPITVAELLSHTGGVGLGDYTARFPPDGPVPSLVQNLTDEFTRPAAPGQRFLYSDTGFNLLQLLVEEVTGVPFHAYMREEILEPLGMRDATYRWTPEVARRLPVGHTLRGDPVAPYVYPGQGSGGLFASVDDLARFATAEMEGTRASGALILSEASLRLLHGERVAVGGLYGLVTDGYGLGHFTERLSDGRTAVWHGGQGYGWMTHLHLVPASGDAIILLANSQRAWPLFAHILRAWSRSVGVASVGMARITWARPVAWGVILLSAVCSFLLLSSWVKRVRRGVAPAPARFVRVTAGTGLLAAIGWCTSQEYLFLFSVLPATTPWLGGAAVLLGVALVLSAAGPSRKGVAAGALALFGSLGASPLGAQQELALLEVSFFPSSVVDRARSGPFEEASVTAVRGSLILPLTYRSPRTVMAARISGSYIGVAPRPLDPAEPLWVESLYDVDLELVAARRAGEAWWVTLVAAPGLAGDMRNVDPNHLTAQGSVLLQQARDAGPSWGVGVAASNAFGETRVVPLLSLDWESPAGALRLLLPTHASLTRKLARAVTAGIQVTLDGNAYRLGREGVLEGGVVRYSVWDVGPRLDFALGPHLRFMVRGGLSYGRRLEAEDAAGIVTEDAGLEAGASLTLGLALVVPPTGH